jgi:hypothetical protein
MEALTEGATEEALTFATTFLGGREAAGSSLGDKGVDSFVNSGLSELTIVFFKGGASLSSSELFKEIWIVMRRRLPESVKEET